MTLKKGINISSDTVYLDLMRIDQLINNRNLLERIYIQNPNKISADDIYKSVTEYIKEYTENFDEKRRNFVDLTPQRLNKRTIDQFKLIKQMLTDISQQIERNYSSSADFKKNRKEIKKYLNLPETESDKSEPAEPSDTDDQQTPPLDSSDPQGDGLISPAILMSTLIPLGIFIFLVISLVIYFKRRGKGTNPLSISNDVLYTYI